MTAATQPTVPGTAPAARPTLMSYEDFMESPDFDGCHAEWVNGEIFTMSPPSTEHQDIVTLLAFLIRGYLFKQSRGKVFVAPLQMKISPDSPGREPDLIFVTKENLGRVLKNRIEGPADLAVEIISPESRQRDRADKFYEYEAGGIREYWLIDPDRRKAEFYVLGPDGAYDPAAPDADGWFASRVIEGFRFKPAWLWMDPPPADEIEASLSSC